MERAPTGELSLVFTDMEGSTARWDRDPEGTHRLLVAHDTAMRTAIAQHEGYECKTAGDGFMVAFEDAEAALRFCLTAQGFMVELGAHVRFGVHRGSVLTVPDPTTGRLDFFGPVVNKAARLESAAHADQIVVSDEARRASVGPWVDLGEHVLRGLEGRHRLWQLGGGTFPRLRTVDVRHTNLPARPDSFVGRLDELAAVREMVERGERLITVLGPGGAGKTRLSQRSAAELLGVTVDSAWFCDLSDARTLDDVVSVVSGVLGVPPSKDAARQVAWAIAGRGKTLLVLDNFEQIIEAAATTVGVWAQLAPAAVFLSTSRIPLRLRGERTVSLASLPTADAIRLLVDRGHGVRADDPDAARLVAALDGLPLAIELAAARTRTMSVSQVLARLGQRFKLLSGGPADLPDRHRALRATLDWSWDLLTEDERCALAQLTVFEGGFTLEAAEAVLQVEDWPADVVQGLVEHSLLHRDRSAGRYHMLLSVIEYGRERLAEQGDRAAVEARHGAWFARLGEDSALRVLNGADAGPRAALVAEQENLVAACRRATARGDAEVAIGTGAALTAILEMRGPFPLGLELSNAVRAMPGLAPGMRHRATLSGWRFRQLLGRAEGAQAELEEVLSEASAAGDGRVVMQTLTLLGLVLRDQGRSDEAIERLQRAVETARATGDRAIELAALCHLITPMRVHGRYADAMALVAGARDLARNLGDYRAEGTLSAQIGGILFEQGRASEALTWFQEALGMERRIGERRLEGIMLSQIGMVCRELGRYDEAAAILTDALAIHQQVGNIAYIGVTLSNLGDLYFTMGRLPDAMRTYEEALAQHRKADTPRLVCVTLCNMGELLVTLGQAELALPQLEAALEAARAMGNRRLEAIALAQIGNAERELERYEEARAHVEQAMEIQAAHGQRRGRGGSQRVLALILAALGYRDEAREHAAQALTTLRAGHDPLEELMALLAVAEVAWWAGDTVAARAALAEAQPLALPGSLGAREVARARALIIGRAPQAAS